MKILIDTSYVMNEPINIEKIRLIITSDEFKSFIKDMYSKTNLSAYQISCEICQGINITTKGSSIANPQSPLISDRIEIKYFNDDIVLFDKSLLGFQEFKTYPLNISHERCVNISNFIFQNLKN